MWNWSSNFWSIGPSVAWPIFDAGKIRANIQVQNALTDQALLTYQQTVLTALSDVENALVAYAQEQAHHKALGEAVVQNVKAVDIANRLYKEGLTDFLQVLLAERALFAAQTALVQSDQALTTDLVALYKALGGGWELLDDPPAGGSGPGEQAKAAAAQHAEYSAKIGQVATP
jgi:outer membrane protein TolC